MLDTLKGTVQNIINSDSFDMKVTGPSPDNKFAYSPLVRVRISSFDTEKYAELYKDRSPYFPEQMLKEKEVLCVAQKRDDAGHVLARVVPL